MPAAKERKRRGRRIGRLKAAAPVAGAEALQAEWPLPASAALGSSVRAEGIEREIRARLPWTVRRCLSVETGRVVLAMAQGADAAFAAASGVVSRALKDVDALPILPREAEDILTITAHERQKWLKDGRLQSAGTRTVKLRGRAKAVTFHVFDPRAIEDALDRDAPSAWREEDAHATAERRRLAAARAALARAARNRPEPAAPEPEAIGSEPEKKRMPKPRLKGWDDFDADGLLR